MGSYLTVLPLKPLPIQKVVIVLLAACTPSIAFADSALQNAANWGLGLGVVSRQEPYTDMSRKTTAFPLLKFENQYLRFFRTTLEAKLPTLQLNDNNQIRFHLVGHWSGAGYKPKDSWILSGMDERKGGLWAGAKVEWRNDMVNISADWMHDVSGHSKGHQIGLRLDRSWRLGEHLTLIPSLGATWQDRKAVNYYYGVASHETQPWRHEYAGKSGVDTELGLQGVYRFNKHHSLMFDARVRRLPSAIKDSPLVDRSTDNRFSLGYLYHF